MRAGRLIKLLRLLETRGRLTAPELATELEVSVRTVLRDVEELSGAGIPVYSVRGRSGGFELVGGRTQPRPLGLDARAPAQRRDRATVRMSPHGRRLAALLGRPVRVRKRSISVPGREDWSECWLEIESIEAAVHDVLGLGDEVEVVRPHELAALVAATARTIADRHDRPSARLDGRAESVDETSRP